MCWKKNKKKFIIRKDIIETSQVVLNFCRTVYFIMFKCVALYMIFRKRTKSRKRNFQMWNQEDTPKCYVQKLFVWGNYYNKFNEMHPMCKSRTLREHYKHRYTCQQLATFLVWLIFAATYQTNRKWILKLYTKKDIGKII
jgi:hypothetical protein